MDIFGGSLTASTALAAVVTSAQDTLSSVWVLAAAAVALPLAFYIIHKVIGLFPKSRGR